MCLPGVPGLFIFVILPWLGNAFIIASGMRQALESSSKSEVSFSKTPSSSYSCPISMALHKTSGLLRLNTSRQGRNSNNDEKSASEITRSDFIEAEISTLKKKILAVECLLRRKVLKGSKDISTPPAVDEEILLYESYTETELKECSIRLDNMLNNLFGKSLDRVASI